MTSDKSPSQKSTATTLNKATPDPATAKGDVTSATMTMAKQTEIEPQPSIALTHRTKMEIATEIFVTMRSAPGVTRKAIIDQFVADAKLSKAGASTYYQLIKAKAK